MKSYLDGIICIMAIYFVLLLYLYIATRKSLIIFNYRHLLTDPEFKGLFKDKKLREKRKRQGKILLYISWALLILFGILCFIPFNGFFLVSSYIRFIIVLIGIASFLISCFFYVRAIHDEVLEEVISSRKTKKNKSSG